jgi:large conductance mechanosensitive channel
MSFIKEFKEFISRGNVMDLAIGVVIGGAFGKIVTSFVDNILMPPIGYLLGGVNFSDYKFILTQGTLQKNADGIEETVGEVAIKYGMAIQSLIDFVLIAFFVFLLVKSLNKIQKEKKADPVTPTAPTKEEILLTEIRDLLKEKK